MPWSLQCHGHFLWRGLFFSLVGLFTSSHSLYPVCPLCQAHLLSAEFGKHLLEAEDLLQKHKLMEADIAIQGDKVKAITAATLQFTEETGEPAGVSLLRPLAQCPRSLA